MVFATWISFCYLEGHSENKVLCTTWKTKADLTTLSPSYGTLQCYNNVITAYNNNLMVGNDRTGLATGLITKQSINSVLFAEYDSIPVCFSPSPSLFPCPHALFFSSLALSVAQRHDGECVPFQRSRILPAPQTAEHQEPGQMV